MKVFKLELGVTDGQYKEMQTYSEALTVEMILFGLRFSYKRHIAIAGGYLMPGRKSLVKKETEMLSHKQATWRMNNWRAMIRSYREKGYSYPTISRIKRQVLKISKEH